MTDLSQQVGCTFIILAEKDVTQVTEGYFQWSPCWNFTEQPGVTVETDKSVKTDNIVSNQNDGSYVCSDVKWIYEISLQIFRLSFKRLLCLALFWWSVWSESLNPSFGFTEAKSVPFLLKRLNGNSPSVWPRHPEVVTFNKLRLKARPHVRILGCEARHTWIECCMTQQNFCFWKRDLPLVVP